MKFKLFCRRSWLICAESLAVLTVLSVILVSALAWRLLSAPLDLDFAKPYIQEALRDSQSGVYTRMDKVVLFWPGVREPLLLGLQGAAVYGRDGSLIASIDEAALSLNKAQLLLGRVRPEGLILKRPSLSIIRNVDNSFDVDVPDMETFGPKREGERESGFVEGDFVEQVLAVLSGGSSASGGGISPLAMLKSFEIEDAGLLIDDRVLALSWALPNSDAVIERVEGGLRAHLDVEFPFEPANPPRLALDAVLDVTGEIIDVDATLHDFNLSLLAEKIPELMVLEGQDVSLDVRVRGRMDAALSVKEANVTALSERGSLSLAALSPEPVAYKDFGVAAAYKAEEQMLEVTKAQVTLGEDAVLEGSAALRIYEEGRKVSGPVRLEIGRIAQAALGPLWPAALAEENAKEWIVDRLGAGVFSNVYAQGDLVIDRTQEEPQVDLQKLVAGFEFEGMSVDYRAPLKPVREAKGKGTFDLDSETLRIDIESAKVLDMDITKADVELVNIIEAGAGQADININLSGPVQSVLTYIRDEPIGAETDIDIANVKGRGDLEVNIGLPTRADVKVSDVKVSAKGRVENVSLPNVVRGLTLSEGPFNVRIADNLLRIDGKGQLAGRPVTLDYREFLISAGQPYAMKVEAALLADPGLRAQFGIDLSAFLEGDAFVDAVYTEFGDGRAEADVKADLTQARLFVDPFDYEKAPGVKGETTLKAVLKNGELKEVRTLRGSAPELRLEPSTIYFRQKGGETELSSGKIPRFTLGETVARLEFDVEQSGRTKIIMDGPFLDLRPFLDHEEKEDKPYENPPLEISVAVDAMRTADEETVQYGKIYADIDAAGRFNQMEMDAIAGAGDLYLRYKPDGSGKRVFRLEADDAGATLKAFGLYGNVRGGTLVIYGEPIRGVFDRNLIGTAEMRDFKVVNAPALAQLISAMSLTGALQNLNSGGLAFKKMKAEFDWNYRPQGSVLVLKDGRTSGNSLGLTFDGTFDNAAQMVDVSGTIIPLSGVNKVIGDIPLVGDILTGGTGALIAATYTMKGPSGEPKISVNPLSVLTPGILRRILFEQ
ncbi:MAG: DUF3971 domain-containing protein [Alphaproteobacteria bacterium]